MAKGVKKPSILSLLNKTPIRYIRKKTENVKGKKKKGLYRANPRKLTRHAPRLRSSITPGTVLILLSGAHRGKRVICLGQFEKSGLLLITGPFRINGVPLRRVNQRYVIATSKKIDISAISKQPLLSQLLKDEPFGRSSTEKNRERKQRLKTNKESQFFVNSDEQKSVALPSDIKKRQDDIDKPLLPFLQKEKLLSQYLKTRFTLRSNMAPHKLVF